MKQAMRRTLPCMLLALLLPGAGLAAAGSPGLSPGEYLARAGDCISCHTAPGGIPYAGGLRMQTPFGDMLTPNITPDPATGIGSWSADDFYRALHDGVGRKVGDLYPVMPYTFYTKVTRQDSDAIYAFLMSLKPVSNPVVVNQLRFPFDIRQTMAFWRELYFREGSFVPDPARGADWNRGAYLVEGLGHCSACHSPLNVLGAVKESKAFTGATIDGWFALNLTSDLKTGLGEWSVDQVVTYLKNGALKGKSTTLGDMAEVVHNSLSFMTDADLKAMAVYLKSIPAKAVRTGPRGVEPVTDQAARLYLDNCSGCHQAKGRGIPGTFPPLAGNGVVLASDPADIVRVVLWGVPMQNGYVPMPGFASALSDQQVAALANYVRTSWGNSAPANTTARLVEAERRNLPGNP